MIPLPSRFILHRRVLSEYKHLREIIGHCSHLQVEAVMRRIHMLNLKIKSYGIKEELKYEEEDF